jgi:carbon monoxide dehydrogenase subunit G
LELSNTCTIPASVERTWQALNDPAFLKDSIAGCESLEAVADNDYKLTIAAKVGPVSARFNGRLRLEDLQPPNAYSVVFEGQGGAAGFAKGRARVTLEPQDGGAATLMTYDAKAQVGGKLAQVGSRLIDGAASKVASDFFAAFNAKMTAEQAPAAAPVTPAAVGRPWVKWVVAAVVAAVIAWLLIRTR